MEEKTKSLDMTQGSPAKLLILFAVPMLIGSVFQLMYNMVDTIVVGRFVSVDALAAIGATSSTTALLLYTGQALTNAVSVIISQAEGAKRTEYLKKAVAHAVYLVLGGSLILGLLAFFGARPMMMLLGTPENIIEQSVTYIQITGGLSVALIVYNGVSAVLCLIYMFRKYPRLRPDRGSFRFDSQLLGDYLRIGLPMCLQNILLSVGMFVITAVINSYGSHIVAAYTIGSKVEQLATISFSNMAFSFSVYAGQNYGAKLYARIKDGLKQGLLIISALALVSTVVMWLFAKPLAMIFMEEDIPVVLEGAVSMIRIEALLFVALGAIWTVNSALRGIGEVKITLVSSVVELVSKIGISVLLPLAVGYVGIWAAAPIGWVLGLIPPLAYLVRWFRKRENTPLAA